MQQWKLCKRGEQLFPSANRQSPRAAEGLRHPKHSDPFRRVSPLGRGGGRCGPGEKKAEKRELGKERREGGEAKPLPLTWKGATQSWGGRAGVPGGVCSWCRCQCGRTVGQTRAHVIPPTQGCQDVVGAARTGTKEAQPRLTPSGAKRGGRDWARRAAVAALGLKGGLEEEWRGARLQRGIAAISQGQRLAWCLGKSTD